MEQIAKKQPQGVPRHLPRGGRPTDVEGMAFVSLRAMTMIEMAQVMKVLEVEGIKDVKLARVRLSRTDAKRMAAGHGAAIQATIMPDDDEHENETPEQALERALHDAKARGDAVKQELLADPEMLSTAGIAERLGMSGEGVRLKHKRHEVLGVNFAKRGIRYPGWQVLENRQLLPALPQIFSILGDNPWGVYRFLLQSHPELGGSRALDALKRGRIDEVLTAATTVATGAFS